MAIKPQWSIWSPKRTIKPIDEDKETFITVKIFEGTQGSYNFPKL